MEDILKTIDDTSVSSQDHINGSFVGSEAVIVPSFGPLEVMRNVLKKDSLGVDSIYYISDVFLLLNSERIRNVLGEDTYRQIISAMVSNVSYSDKSAANLPDSLVLNTIKSRYIQTPSEMRAYASDITNRFSDLKDLVEKEQQRILEEQAKKVAESHIEVKPEQSN